MIEQLDGILVRRLSASEWSEAYRVVVQLRTHLDEAEFVRRVQCQIHDGYELLGAFSNDALIGVLGMRPVRTLARGAYLHVDDLVVDGSLRGAGAGRALMAFAESDARARGLATVFLDARQQAIPFYEKLGYAFHPSPSMKKAIS